MPPAADDALQHELAAAEAAVAFDRGMYDEAVSLLTRAIEAIPRQGPAGAVAGPASTEAVAAKLRGRLLSNRSAAYLELGRASEAEADAAAAVILGPAWYRPHLRLALALLSQRGRQSEAVDVLGRALLGCSTTPSERAELQAAYDSAAEAAAGREAKRRKSEAGRAGAGAEADAPAPPLAVLVLCGFLGTGKTTLVRHVLEALAGSGQGCSRVGLIINDLAELNVDADLRLLLAAPALLSSPGPGPGPGPQRPFGGDSLPHTVELSNGCIWCGGTKADRCLFWQRGGGEGRGGGGRGGGGVEEREARQSVCVCLCVCGGGRGRGRGAWGRAGGGEGGDRRRPGLQYSAALCRTPRGQLAPLPHAPRQPGRNRSVAHSTSVVDVAHRLPPLSLVLPSPPAPGQLPMPCVHANNDPPAHGPPPPAPRPPSLPRPPAATCRASCTRHCCSCASGSRR